jgi:hypothetical protein
MGNDTLTPIPPHPYVTLLRTVSERRPAHPRGPDGGYLVPRHLYTHLLGPPVVRTTMPPTLDGSLQADPPAVPPANTRVFAIAPLANSSLLANDEFAARALLTTLVDTLTHKIPRWLLRTCPLELEASGEATYRTQNNKVVSAFEADQTVFRLTTRMPDIKPDAPTNTRVGKQIGKQIGEKA